MFGKEIRSGEGMDTILLFIASARPNLGGTARWVLLKVVSGKVSQPE
jgi:hypothetical protein